MEATYRALRDCGYASLTMQDIADEYENSKSSLYYHYESKQELLVAFLEYALYEFATELSISDEPSRKQLQSLFDTLVPRSIDRDHREFRLALFELRAQAPHEPAFAEQFERIDRVITDALVDHLEAGIESGEFDDVDVEATAEMYLTLFNGATYERATTAERFDAEPIRSALDTHVQTVLVEGNPE
jgi:AcrR family transcriptional regulator